MRLSSVDGVLLCILFVISMVSVFSISEINAQENVVTAKSIGFEKTTIIEFNNNDVTEIESIRMWLGSDFTFKSFKTEKGWTGKKTPQGVIVFNTTKPIKPNESVKFGIKTDKKEPGINWKVIDKNENVLSTGITLVTETISKEDVGGTTGAITLPTGVLEYSSFKLIPEKPKVGSSLRIVGENFGVNENLKFYIGGNRIKSFETDETGYFIITTKIPEDQNPVRTDFIIRDSLGSEKVMSLRIGESDNRMISNEGIRLTISGLPEKLDRGDIIKVFGTAEPDSTVTATIKNEKGEIITTIAVQVDLDGNWSHEEIISLNAELGKHTVEITDGKNSILRTYNIESSKLINISPKKLKFNVGESFSFNGTAVPNKEIEFVLEDPNGNDYDSKILSVGSDGFVSVEFTTDQSAVEGTYVLIASQGEALEIIVVGLGEIPKELLIAKLDKTNYSVDGQASIELKGPASASISLLLLDPADQPIFDDIIQLGPNGSAEYVLDLEGFSTGVYTLVITRGNSQSTEIFSIGLDTGSGPIEIRTTKNTYLPGDVILILGKTGLTVLITLSLVDPDGTEVKQKEIFSNDEGVFSNESFRIPLDAKAGLWVIKGNSGPNFTELEIDVASEAKEGLAIRVDKSSYKIGDIVTISGLEATTGGRVRL